MASDDGDWSGEAGLTALGRVCRGQLTDRLARLEQELELARLRLRRRKRHLLLAVSKPPHNGCI